MVGEDPSTYVAPREKIPLDAFRAADEYLAFHDSPESDLIVEPHNQADHDLRLKTFAEKYHVTESALVQALRHKSNDRENHN